MVGIGEVGVRQSKGSFFGVLVMAESRCPLQPSGHLDEPGRVGVSVVGQDYTFPVVWVHGQWIAESVQEVVVSRDIKVPKVCRVACKRRGKTYRILRSDARWMLLEFMAQVSNGGPC